MTRVKDIAAAIEDFAPKSLQESYDNAGLQVGSPDMEAKAALLCIDATEEVIDEAIERRCNLVVTHHPLIFKGLKHVTGETATERIVIKALREGIAVYSAHTNLDSAWDGVSHEMAHMLGLSSLQVLEPKAGDASTGLGVIGELTPTPRLEFLRRVKETFNVKSLRYSAQSPQIVVRKVAVCGGSGASLIGDALRAGADTIVTGDVKYHDFTTFGLDILIADIGHYESELCTKAIFFRILKERCPDFPVYFAESDTNPVKCL